MARPIKKKKTTVELPESLLKEALAVTGKSLNETIVMGLRLIAAKQAFDGLRSMRGRYKAKQSLDDLRGDS